MLKRFNHIPSGKIEVIHLGVNGVNMNNPPGHLTDHLGRYGLTEKKYFLYVGTLEPRKNIPGIIEAFNQVITADKKYKKSCKTD